MRTFTTVLALLSALVMFASGLVKVLSSSFRADQSDMFEIAGSQFPAWFFLLVGVLELVIAVMLVLPKTRVIGGLGLAFVMLGALFFNLVLASDTKEILDDAGEVIGQTSDPASFALVNVVLAALGGFVALVWALLRRKGAKATAQPAAPAT